MDRVNDDHFHRLKVSLDEQQRMKKIKSKKSLCHRYEPDAVVSACKVSEELAESEEGWEGWPEEEKIEQMVEIFDRKFPNFFEATNEQESKLVDLTDSSNGLTSVFIEGYFREDLH